MTKKTTKNPTQELEKAFAEASKLPVEQQDELARWILTELAADRAWDDILSRSSDTLADLGRETLREHRGGRTRPLDPDRL